MPRLMLPIADVDLTILRPMITDIMKDLFLLTGLDSNTKVFYPGDTGQNMQPDSSLAFEGDKNRFANGGWVFIEVNRTPNEDWLLTNSADRPSDNFTFMDKHLQTFTRPTRVYNDIELSIRYRSSSKVDAEKWRANLITKVSQGNASYIHQPVTYSYDIPREVITILKEIHRLQENNHGFGETDFKEWFMKRSSENVTITTNQVGSKYADTFTVRENLGRIQGSFDTSFPDKGSFVDDTRAWETSLSYRLQVDIVEGYVLLHPIIVHNQLLSSDFISYETEEMQFNYYTGLNLKQQASHYFEAPYLMKTFKENLGEIIPPHDDFKGSSLTGTVPVVTALIKVDDEDKDYTLLKLDELGDIHLDENVINFLKTSEFKYLTGYNKDGLYKSIFNLTYFKNDKLISPSDVPILCNDKLEVTRFRTTDPRAIHHVRLSLVTGLNILENDALERMRWHPEMFQIYVCLLNTNFNIPCKDIEVIGKGNNRRVSREWVNEFKRLYNSVMKTVGTYYITGLFGKGK